MRSLKKGSLTLSHALAECPLNDGLEPLWGAEIGLADPRVPIARCHDLATRGGSSCFSQ